LIKKLSIVIPVYNEEKTVQQLLKKVIALNLAPIQKEIIIVDDGSTDSTADSIHRFIENKKNIQFYQKKRNGGKGSALSKGFQIATGDYLIIQDADLEYNPTFIPLLLQPILNKKTQVVYGTRLARLPNFTRDERSFRFALHYFGNRFLSLLVSILYLQYLTDIETCYKVFPKSVLKGKPLQATSFDFEVEITCKILNKKMHIVEVPIRTNPRDQKSGKKLRTFYDGFMALFSIFKFRFTA